MSNPSPSPAVDVQRYLHQMRNAGELADELKVSTNYIQAMKRHGLRMPGGKASLTMAFKFFDECPDFKVRESITRKPG